METTPKVIGLQLYEPTKRSQPPQFTTLFCKLNGECPVLKAGQCIHNRMLGRGCVYGLKKTEHGPLPRAKAHYAWVSKKKEQLKDGPVMPAMMWPGHMEIIGDYVYLPYVHMTMNEKVPFLAHGGLFLSEHAFVPMEKFTPETVVNIVTFRPNSLMGGEITEYQEKSIPIFLFHLKIKMPEMYKAAAALSPRIEAKTFNVEGIESLNATIGDIPAGVTEGYVVGKGMMPALWNGKVLSVAGSIEMMQTFFGDMRANKGTSCAFTFEPCLKTTKVKVTDPDLIARLLISNPSLLKK